MDEIQIARDRKKDRLFMCILSWGERTVVSESGDAVSLYKNIVPPHRLASGKVQLCPPFGVSPYVKKYLFPMSALAIFSLVACKPTPPPPPAATSTPTPAPVAAAAAAGEQPKKREGGPGPGGGPGGGNRPDFAQRGQERLERMQTDLSLTPDQTEKIKAIFAQQMTSMQGLRDDQSLDKDQRMAKMKETRAAIDTQVAAILTPEQKGKWDEFRKQREAEMADRRNKRQKDGGGAPPAP